MVSSDHTNLARILVVDDEDANQRLLDGILRGAGYTSIRAIRNPENVSEAVDAFEPDLLLLDLHMPNIDGFDVLRMLGPKLRSPCQLPVIMLTGDTSHDARRNALALGAKDFVPKPFDADEVLLRIRNQLETHFLQRTLKRQNAELESRVNLRTIQLDQSEREIVERLARASEIRDGATGRHTYRVGRISSVIARCLGEREDFVELIGRAAPLHDIGKIGVPDSVLLKKGKLTADEVKVIRSHTIIGAQLLSGGRSHLVRMAQRIARSHHERWDGSGYPDGLSGNSIPLEARIVSVADYIDALTHDRPYRAACPLHDVLSQVLQESGRHFDPGIVEVITAGPCVDALADSAMRQTAEFRATAAAH